MAVWRRKALEQWPELRDTLQEPWSSPSDVFELLVPRAHEAFEDGDEVTLAPILDYAAWCLQQRAEDLWTSAGFNFYDPLLAGHGWHLRRRILARLEDDVIRRVWGVWPLSMSEEQIAELKRLVPIELPS